MQRALYNTDIYALCLILGLVLCVIAKLLQPKQFSNLTLLPFNNQYLINAKEKPLFQFSTIILIFNYLLMVGVLMYYSFLHFYIDYTFNIYHFLILVVMLVCFYLFKSLIEILLSWIFDIKSKIKVYLFEEFAYIQQTGMILIPFVFLMIFGDFNKKVIIILAISVLCLLKLINFIIVLRKNQKYYINHFFYFLLYICALKFTPYIMIYKVFTYINF